MHRLLGRLFFVSLLIAGLVSCAAEHDSPLESPADSAAQGADAKLGDVQRELAELQRPAGVEIAVWDALCQALLSAVQAPRASAAAPRSVSADPPGITPGPFHSERPNVEHWQQRISWYHIQIGDYDQNCEVNVADLVPLAIHLGKFGIGDPLHFEHGTIEFVVDGNVDGAVTVADVTPIGVHFGERMEYRLYASEDLGRDFPHYGEVPTIEPIAEITGSSIRGSNTAQRHFLAQIPGELVSHYWIVPVIDGQPGLSSWPASPGPLGAHSGGVPQYREPWTDLQYDASSGEVSWRSIVAGDVDRSGFINISDLTVLAANVGEAFEETYLDPLNLYADPDCNRDGVTDKKDLLQIGAFLNTKHSGYHLYYSADLAGVPANPWDPSTGAAVSTLTFLRSEVGLHGVYSLDFTPQPGSYLWLRTYYGDEEGPVSEIIQLP